MPDIEQKRYIVTVTEVGVETVHAGMDWELVGPKATAEYGYTPEITKQKSYQREVFRQELDDLELSQVVLAINRPGNFSD